ncbi:MAG TPA: acyl-CoA thioesterase [Conexivisphaerales archaeon]|nr:acyl-CoA thioesterase [Conexivisphaerales archaeon]
MKRSELKGRRVSESSETLVRLMMPTDANPSGNVFGGTILRLMDEVSGIVAVRHARSNAVTASVDRMDFWAPVYVGNLLVLKAAVNYVGRTSMEVGVRIEAEDLKTGKRTHTGSCYLTYVALGPDRRPAAVPPVIPETQAQKRRYLEARERRRRRMRDLEGASRFRLRGKKVP